jgi:hypothetical protein
MFLIFEFMTMSRPISFPNLPDLHDKADLCLQAMWLDAFSTT